MKKTEWNEAMNQIDTDLVENFVLKQQEAVHRKKKKVLWLRMGAVAACFMLVFAAFAGGALGSCAAGTFFIIEGNLPSGLATIAAGAVLGGLSIFTFFASRAFTGACVYLTKKTVLWIGSLFFEKEETK